MPVDRFSESEIKVLRECLLFKGLPEESLEALLCRTPRRTVSAGAFIFHEGQSAQVLYVLIRGRAKLVQTTSEGQQVVVRYVGPGQIFGGAGFMGDHDYPASARAVEECLALALASDDMTAHIRRYPHLAVNMLDIMAQRILTLQERYRELATQRVEQRLANAVLRLLAQSGIETPKGVLIDIPLTQQDLAEMTGTTLYTVNRILHKWEGTGLVRTAREQVTITGVSALRAIAEDLPSSSEDRRRD